MIFELLAIRNMKKQENFTEKTNKTFSNVTILLSLVYLACILVLWVRVIVSAFACGTGEGISSILVPSLYSLYKFGDLIKLSCNQLY